MPIHYILRRIINVIFIPSRQRSTIFALSSGYGKCGVAVIRLSGSNSSTALKCLTGLSSLPQPRMATLRSIKHPTSKETLDKGLILWFPGPHSFTGEDCCEFHVHGGPAVVTSILDALLCVPSLQLATPGEFTRRAFYNGKLDLTEVEGLADLLQAETEHQRKQAFYQAQGALSKRYNKWRQILLHSVAHIEAFIDFEATETLDNNILNIAVQDIKGVVSEIENHLKDGAKGETLRNGVKTVILGAPNVGKSSLLNLLCKRPAAIVSPIEGTTRDIVEVTLNISGYPVVLADTAGLRTSTVDPIEKEGINRALQNYEHADLVIFVIDSTTYFQWFEPQAYLKDYLKRLGLTDMITENSNKQYIAVFNKVDLVEPEVKTNEMNHMCFISCKTEEGLQEFLVSLTEKLKLLCGEPNSEQPSLNQIRHKQHLQQCLANLHLFINMSNGDTVLMAEYLRKSLRSLGMLVGLITTEDVLDVIFKDFCIGK